MGKEGKKISIFFVPYLLNQKLSKPMVFWTQWTNWPYSTQPDQRQNVFFFISNFFEVLGSNGWLFSTQDIILSLTYHNFVTVQNLCCLVATKQYKRRIVLLLDIFFDLLVKITTRYFVTYKIVLVSKKHKKKMFLNFLECTLPRDFL